MAGFAEDKTKGEFSENTAGMAMGHNNEVAIATWVKSINKLARVVETRPESEVRSRTCCNQE